MSTNEAGTQGKRVRALRGVRDFAHRWPFRRKLNVLVGVPLAVVGTLLAYLITDQVMQARDAADAARLVRDSTEVAKLVNRVEAEHQQAILLSVHHEAKGRAASPEAYQKAQIAVDNQVQKVRDTFGDRLSEGEAAALKEINGLTELRRLIESGYTPADNIDPAYANAAKGVIDGLGLERNSALAATFTGNLLDSLLRADGAHSSFETSVFSARTGDSNALIEFINAVSLDELYAFQADRFARFATQRQVEQLSGVKYNSAQATILQHYAELQIDPGGLQADSPAEIRRALAAALESYPVYREQAQNRLEITTSLIGQIATRADQASEDAYSRALTLFGAAVLGFVLWLVFSVAVRRSVVVPVQALTGAAREVADVAGRELARVADEDAEDAGPPRLREVPVSARDEIGDLAEAFNSVQTTAAALLERQVLSRRNVAEMFGNVGRRVSNLTTRQLALIDAVERGETDPALLERLYSIDHIAVRLRRNADSLMLLAGIRETVLESGPTPLADVVRASLAQIEGFQRVRLTARTQVMVQPDIIGDLTLMVAELIENAVSFSPADSPVEVAVSTTSEGALIEIADHGLGMSPERLAEENARLIRRERLDLVPTKVLGLFVVGTLARRWGIEVALARTLGGGLTAAVTVPTTLLLTMSPVGMEKPGADQDAERAAAPLVSWTAGTRTPQEGTTVTAVPRRTARTPEPAPASGPRPSTVVPVGGASSPSGRLPHRVPRRTAEQDEPADRATAADTRAAHGEEAAAPASPARFVPSPRSGTAGARPAPGGPPSSGGARPLRRRVKGATLRQAAGPAVPTTRQEARPEDADAVRSEIEEFEAAVEQARRDAVAATTDPGGRPAAAAGDTRSGAPAPAEGAPAAPADQNHPRRDDRQGENDLPEGAEQ